MRRNGFTLVELLIVIGLIAILFVIAVPRFSNPQRTGQVTACRANLQSLEMALEGYYSENGGYPSSGDQTTLVSNGYLRVAAQCQDQAGNQLGSYLWKTDPASATAFTYSDGTSTTGTYRGGRAFCTLHGIVDPQFPGDWRPGAVPPSGGGGGEGGGGG